MISNVIFLDTTVNTQDSITLKGVKVITGLLLYKVIEGVVEQLNLL